MKQYLPLYASIAATVLPFLFPACKTKDICENMPREYFTYIQDSIRDDLFCDIPGILEYKELGTGEITSFWGTNMCATKWNEGNPKGEFPCTARNSLERYGHFYWGQKSTLELYYNYRQIDGVLVFRYEFFAFERPFMGEPGVRISQLPQVDLWMDGKEYKNVSILVSHNPFGSGGNDTLWYRPDLCVLKAYISMNGNRYVRQF